METESVMLKAMNKTKVYLDTSVISYLEQNDAPEQRQITNEVWQTLKSGKYDIVISKCCRAGTFGMF